MIAYVAGWTRKKDSVFKALAAAVGGAVRLPFIGLSFRPFPESKERAEAALAVAKRKPKSALGGAAKYRLIWAQYNWARRYFTKHPKRVAVCWNGITGSRRAFMDGAKDAGAKRLFVELAPFPGRVTIDPAGVNALNSVPRAPEFFLKWSAGNPDRTGEGWRALGANLTARASRRADVGQGDGATLSDAGQFLFCPLQVPNDSQITLFADWVETVDGMLAALADAADALPEGWHIRVKEHPSAKSSLAEPLAAAVERAKGRIVIDNQTDTFAQVAASGGVITINSSVGLQAFFYDKPVITLGKAFFAIPGLVTTAAGLSELRDVLSGANTLGFDAPLRAAFMNYLDQEYYQIAEPGPDGSVTLDPKAIKHKLIAAEG
ncbi:capsular polysaccharide export protein, LipB/KpsS family [Actibacterium lipolyticum]|uniref:Capsule polysaccharide biosynthesis protein n=1 Tax=Actibacterium lipolyticum TaxID=1524263 RepID=A0A238JKA3_9RHOB|nr:capsular biosynthesis protein [Actibacterium lipolyticum]SMX30644.1 Capsule polysaccharide biosynthesis protein [Actibacterium lipolyticum]